MMNKFRLRRRVTAPEIKVDPKLLTRKEPKDQCDVNKIVANARRGMPPSWLARGQPVYIDASELPRDLTAAYEQVQRAEEAFSALPAAVRTAMDNDPRALEGWLADPDNRELAVKHGLFTSEMAESEAEASPPSQPSPKGKKVASRASNEEVAGSKARSSASDTE